MILIFVYYYFCLVFYLKKKKKPRILEGKDGVGGTRFTLPPKTAKINGHNMLSNVFKNFTHQATKDIDPWEARNTQFYDCLKLEIVSGNGSVKGSSDRIG